MPTHCCFCGQQCGIQLKVKDEKVVGFEPWEEFPFNRGKLCPKGVKRYMQDEHPDRLLTPLVRDEARGFQPIDWDTALDRTAREIQRIQSAYGRDAFAVLTGASLTNEKAYLMGKFARVALRTANIDYNGRLCMVSAAAASKKILGIDRSANPWSDIPKAKVILVAGANIAECAPITTDYLWQARENGAQLIVLDPRLTPIARTADLFIPVRSGGDIGVFYGMLHVMVQRGWINRDFIAAHTTGWDAVEAIVERYTPEYAATVASVPASMIVRAAEMWGPAETSFLLHARGIEHHSKGVENCMAAINLVVATGRIGREGCGYAMITGQGNGQGAREQGQKCDQLPGARDLENPAHREYIAGVWGVDESTIPHTGLSAVPLLEAIHDGRIKGLLLLCFNPAVSLPDGDFIREALSRLEFFTVIDFFMSETARYADLVLPGSLMEEDEGTTTNVEGRVIHHRQVVKPPAGARQDWRIICDLAKRLGAGEKFAYAVDARHLRRAAHRLERRRRRLRRYHVGAHRSRDGRVLAVPVARSSRDAAPLRRLAVRPSRRQGAFSAGRLAARRRRAGRRLPDRADDGTRRVAVSVGHADASHRRPRRPVPAAAVRDPSAPGRVAGDRGWRFRPRREPPRRRRRSRAGREDHSPRHRVRPLPLAARSVGEQLHDPRDRSHLQDSRVQDLRRSRVQGARAVGRHRGARTGGRRHPVSELAFFIDYSRCIGCQACVQACEECDTHRGRSLIHLETIERRDSVQTAPQVCMHCEDPICAQVCPADAIKQTAEGVVQSSLKPRCIGCSNCVLACPFGVPKYDGAADQMMKCDMCYDRTSTGRRPMCATVCPSGALAFTTIAEIMQTRQGRAVNDWQFGDEHVRTKVFVLVPTEVTHVNVAVIPLSSLRRSPPAADPYDVAALLEAR